MQTSPVRSTFRLLKSLSVRVWPENGSWTVVPVRNGDSTASLPEKRGVIKVFDSLSDTTPTVFADLRTEVDNYWDRGLLGLALDPNFPQKPWVYVLYARDA